MASAAWTSTLTSLADFVGNLENNGYFVRPVEIISSEEQKNTNSANANAITLIKFSMKAQFVMPGSQPAPERSVAAATVAPRPSVTPMSFACSSKRARMSMG